jgi:F0F1-type ATP synthase assembly protein I
LRARTRDKLQLISVVAGGIVVGISVGWILVRLLIS